MWLTRHRIVKILANVVLAVVAIVGVILLLTPNKETKALSFAGSGTIIDSQNKASGTSSQYWARISCDPQEVREFVRRRPFARYFPEPHRIRKMFSKGFMRWPPNFTDYSDDFISYQTGTGRFALVAFNDKGANEVLYITWSH